MLQRCLAVTLQKCFVDEETSPNLMGVGSRHDGGGEIMTKFSFWGEQFLLILITINLTDCHAAQMEHRRILSLTKNYVGNMLYLVVSFLENTGNAVLHCVHINTVCNHLRNIVECDFNMNETIYTVASCQVFQLFFLEGFLSADHCYRINFYFVGLAAIIILKCFGMNLCS